MRAVNSNGISGPQAICVAAFAWWWGGHREQVLASAQEWLQKAGPTSLMSRVNYQIGAVILAGVPEIPDRMMLDLTQAPGVGDMLAHAALEWCDGLSPAQSRAEVKLFLQVQLQAEVGLMVLETDWFERNKAAIAAEKRRLKTVRSVLES